VRERRGSYNGFCCRLYPFICWIIIKEGPGNFSGGRSPHWVNHVNLCLSCIVCLLCFCFCICFILLLRGPVFLKTKKIKYTPKTGREKYFLFVDSTMSHPWTKHILSFVHQSLGFNMTLGICSHYIELCPPPFGYPSKHMESSCCLLHHEFMSMPCLLSLIFCCVFVQGKFY
jgi:hypothetical protein